MPIEISLVDGALLTADWSVSASSQLTALLKLLTDTVNQHETILSDVVQKMARLQSTTSGCGGSGAGSSTKGDAGERRIQPSEPVVPITPISAKSRQASVEVMGSALAPEATVTTPLLPPPGKRISSPDAASAPPQTSGASAQAVKRIGSPETRQSSHAATGSGHKRFPSPVGNEHQARVPSLNSPRTSPIGTDGPSSRRRT